MSVALEEGPVKAHVCSNCEATGTEKLFRLPEGWVEVRIRSGQGIHLDSVVCVDCRSAITRALFDIRVKPEEAKAEVPEAKESVSTRQAARKKRVAEIKEETAEVEETPADASVVEGDIQENSVDSVEKTD